MPSGIQQNLTQIKATVHKFKLPELKDILLVADTDPGRALTLCPACRSPFTKPTTLPCGYTLCFDCIPKLTSFQCPSFTCLRTHTNINKTTVLIEEIQSSMSIDNNIQSIKTMLNCPICFMRLNDPTTTRCGHSFCKSCLDTISNNFHCKKCPICRSELNNINKCNQLLHRWVSLFNKPQDIPGKEISRYIPVIEVENMVIVPPQACLVHLSKDYSLFKEMSEMPDQAHQAICLSKNKDNQYDCIGTMLQISNIEWMPDLQKCVILVKGLYHVQINNFLIEKNEFTGEIVPLDYEISDSFNELLPKSNCWSLPNNVESEIDKSSNSNGYTSAIPRKRHCTSLMRSSSSIKSTYRQDNVMPGAYNRLNWSDLMLKQLYGHSSTSLLSINSKAQRADSALIQ